MKKFKSIYRKSDRVAALAAGIAFLGAPMSGILAGNLDSTKGELIDDKVNTMIQDNELADSSKPGMLVYNSDAHEYVLLEDGKAYNSFLKRADVNIVRNEDGTVSYYAPSDCDIVIGEGPNMECYYILYELAEEEVQLTR